ncbi:flagellin [Aliiruegeria haliotis]|uniref:Flagellin n=1 Tax=Aliiruegeria haliotis TaxID=1280846 RepID=A0A2T0RE74_9RHOB|nr:flagellin [Aliiruegeria haliotis]PRY19457.1 flagellin [Aliiruegeria haliotis]
MTSILTNTSSMVALQTLKGINANLNQVQSEISTGKTVSSAKDNSAVWAISKVMESDVNGFKAISDSLSLGESTVAVASQAAETVTDLLTEMKGKIVAAQEDNVDLTKIQSDIDALESQINSVVSAAQFNGLNLVDGAGGGASILSSLDRDSSGNVTASSITVAEQNLGTSGYTAKNVFNTNTTGAPAAGAAFATSVADAGTADIEFDGDVLAEGDQINLRIGDSSISYTVTAEDAAATSKDETIAINVKKAIEDAGIAGISVDYDATTDSDRITITNSTGETINIAGTFQNAGSGGLSTMASIDVTSDASGALAAIDTLIDTAVDAAAAFGSVQGRIETQAEFISNLTDSLTAGIGAMVDADMEEASAKLQALQVQQQLGIQSLSIANSSPQSVLSLFQ